MYFPWLSKLRYSKNTEFSIFTVFRHLNTWAKIQILWITYHVFSKNRTSRLQTSNNTTWREGRWTGAGKYVLTVGHRVCVGGDRQTKCLSGDRQRTVWCLEQDQLWYLRNRRTKCVLTVSCRRSDKLGWPSNSLCFCSVHTTSHVPSELFTFKCLGGHVCQRWGPVSRKTVGRCSTSLK
jgi:hypothetical protein